VRQSLANGVSGPITPGVRAWRERCRADRDTRRCDNQKEEGQAGATRAKTVLTEASGQVGIEVPRDRAGTFEPQIVKKRQRRLTGVDEMVLSLYAKGLTTRRPLRAAAPAARRLRDHGRCVPIPALAPCRSRSSGAYLVLHLGQARRSVRWPTSPPAIYSNSHASFCHIMKKHARPRIAAAVVVESAQKLIA
jgi:hypothetical protein